MPPEELRLDLTCPSCRWAHEHDRAAIVERLRSVGMLKRDPHASVDELRELFVAVAPRLACPQCGQIGLHAAPSPEADADWPSAARCEVCGVLIPAERLEVFPNSTTCVACQRNDDRGTGNERPDYCPRCGATMVLRQTRGAGLTRYALVCSATPSCSRS